MGPFVSVSDLVHLFRRLAYRFTQWYTPSALRYSRQKNCPRETQGNSGMWPLSANP